MPQGATEVAPPEGAEQRVQLDPNKVIEALRQQIANASVEVATRDALLGQLQEQWQEEKATMQEMLDAQQAEIERLRTGTTSEENGNGRAQQKPKTRQAG